MVSIDVDPVVPYGYSLSRSSLPENGNIRVLYLQGLLQMDVSCNCEFDDSCAFLLHSPSQCALIPIVFERGDSVDLASFAATGIHSSAHCTAESRFFRDFLLYRDSVTDSKSVIHIVDVVKRLVFEGSPDKRSYALAVIVDDGLAEIIGVIPCSVLLASETSYRAA